MQTRPKTFRAAATLRESGTPCQQTMKGLEVISLQLDHLIGLLEARAEKGECICSIDWDHRCPLHGGPYGEEEE